jgi:transcriptional regulator with XRE-family HTH domain
MSNNAKRRIPSRQPPQSMPAPLVADEREEFGKRLYQALIDADMSQSDLAREVFNETKEDPRTGYEIVVGRDRISQYVKGRQFPEPRTFKKICEVLGKKPEELAPKMVGSTIERENPSFEIRMVGDRIDAVLLRINKIVPLSLATKIGEMIDAAEKKR